MLKIISLWTFACNLYAKESRVAPALVEAVLSERLAEGLSINLSTSLAANTTINTATHTATQAPIDPQSDSLFNHEVFPLVPSSVQQACLVLQDTYQVDVPLLLFCLWAGQSYGVLSESVLRQAQQTASLWSEQCVRPLRHIRQQMKQTMEDDDSKDVVDSSWLEIREQIKQLELSSEKQLLLALAALLNSPQDSSQHSLQHSSEDVSTVADAKAEGIAMENMVQNIALCFPLPIDVYSANDRVYFAACIAIIVHAAQDNMPYDDVLARVLEYQ